MCPFQHDPRADVTAHIFDAFRRRKMGIGAYYSKADWHSPNYWHPDQPGPWSRGVNYSVADHPDRWQRYVEFVHDQIEELMTNYGPIDILWLDAGWVKAPREDIDMDGMAARARRINPDLIIVDRWCKTAYEDYETPEQKVPEEPMFVPWESNISMTGAFAYNPHEKYKTTRELIHLLVNVVAKGGNLLLNVAPTPSGAFPKTAVERLCEIGEWMEINQEAIFGTRVCSPYAEGSWAFTQNKTHVYAFRMLAEGETVPERLELPQPEMKTLSSVTLLGSRAEVPFRREDGVLSLFPGDIQNQIPNRHALVFRLKR